MHVKDQAEKADHMKEDILFVPGKPRFLSALLAVLYEECCGRPDLQEIILEAAWIGYRLNKTINAFGRTQWHILNPEQVPFPWTMRMENFTFFWRGPFSQWHIAPFKVDGVTYNCAEQFIESGRKTSTFRRNV
jgi:hypothetical protein